MPSQNVLVSKTMIRRIAIPAVVVVAFLILGGIADLISISRFGYHLWNLMDSSNSGEVKTSLDADSAQDTPSIPTPTTVATTAPTPTPTPIPPLGRQLEVAISISSRSERDDALLAVAQHAISKKDYWTAFRAADASPSTSAQARSLALVVRCAIQDKEYALAEHAANKIKARNYRDGMKREVIEARNPSTSEVGGNDGRRLNIGFKTCRR